MFKKVLFFLFCCILTFSLSSCEEMLKIFGLPGDEKVSPSVPHVDEKIDKPIFFSSSSENGLSRMSTDGSSVERIIPWGYHSDVSPDESKIVYHTNDGYWDDSAQQWVSTDNEIWLANIDGSDVTNLTNNDDNDYDPCFSPDGSKILFVTDRNGNLDLYTIDLDGSNPTQITTSEYDECFAEYSPDGSKISYAYQHGSYSAIMIADADGQNAVDIIQDSSLWTWGSHWSPDGSKILFTNWNYDGTRIGALYSINTDSSDFQLVFKIDGIDCQDGSYSPDGSKIVFEAKIDGYNQICSIDSDGTSFTQLTDEPNNCFHANWIGEMEIPDSTLPDELLGSWYSAGVTVTLTEDTTTYSEVFGDSNTFSIEKINLNESYFIVKYPDYEEYGKLQWEINGDQLSLASYEFQSSVSLAENETTVTKLETFSRIPVTSDTMALDLGYAGGGSISGVISTSHMYNQSEIAYITINLATYDFSTGATTNHGTLYTTSKESDVNYSFSNLDPNVGYYLNANIYDENRNILATERRLDESQTDYHFHISTGSNITQNFVLFAMNDGGYYESDKASVNGVITIMDEIDLSMIDRIEIELDNETGSDDIELTYSIDHPSTNSITYEFNNLKPNLEWVMDFNMYVDGSDSNIELGELDDFILATGTNTKNASLPICTQEEVDFVQGTRYMWFADDVGLLKVQYIHNDGSVTDIELVNSSIVTSDGFFPLKIGNEWAYERSNPVYLESAITEYWECTGYDIYDGYEIECTSSNANGHFGIEQTLSALTGHGGGSSGSSSVPLMYMSFRYMLYPKLILESPLSTGHSWIGHVSQSGTFFGFGRSTVENTNSNIKTKAGTFNNVVKVRTDICWDIGSSSLNTTPIADAGEDQTVSVNSEVTLNASASSDIDGDNLGYIWSISSQPEGSDITIDNSDLSEVSFTPEVAGDYVIQLTVSDGIASSSDYVQVVASEPKKYPNINEIVSVTINDGVSGSGEGNGDRKIQVGEEINFDVEIINNGEATAYDITGEIILNTYDANHCTVIDDNDSIDSILSSNTETFDGFDISVLSYPNDDDLDFILTITYEDTDGNTYTDDLIISLEVEKLPIISITPDVVNFYVLEGETSTPSKTVLISNIGAGVLVWDYEENEEWLTVNRNGNTLEIIPDPTSNSLNSSSTNYGFIEITGEEESGFNAENELIMVKFNFIQETVSIPEISKVSNEHDFFDKEMIRETSNYPHFEWSASDSDGSIDHFVYSVNGGESKVLSSSTTSITLSDFNIESEEDDLHTFTIYAVDNEGYSSDQITWEFSFERIDIFIYSFGMSIYPGDSELSDFLDIIAYDADDFYSCYELTNNQSSDNTCSGGSRNIGAVTVSSFEKELESIPSTTNDRIIVFLGGHGNYVYNGKDYYIQFYDEILYGNPAFTDSDSRIDSYINNIKGNKILILDSCHSGAYINDFEDGPNYSVIMSSDFDEVTNGAEWLNNSIFMYYLSDGLGMNGSLDSSLKTTGGEFDASYNADINLDHIITITELYNYAKSLTKGYISQLNIDYYPKTFNDENAQLFLKNNIDFGIFYY